MLRHWKVFAHKFSWVIIQTQAVASIGNQTNCMLLKRPLLGLLLLLLLLLLLKTFLTFSLFN